MQTSQHKAYKGMGMEGRIATWYARNTAKDMDEFRSVAARLAKDVRAGSRVLEVAPGPGYLSVELAKRGQYEIAGLDISKSFVAIATENARNASVKIDFRQGDAAAMPFADDAFDLTVCRHVLHSIPHANRVLAELKRVTRAGGYLHLIPEDYGMLEFQRRNGLDPRDFWHVAPARFEEKTDTDLFIGRNAYTLLSELGFDEITVDYAVVDTIRTSRDTFARILEAWRDGYTESIAEYSGLSRESVTAYFNAMIENVRDPKGYAVWMVPIVAARVPR